MEIVTKIAERADIEITSQLGSDGYTTTFSLP
ncbi:MAG: hypothetical protein ACJAYN_001529 [Bermanella sp.]|jgi:hypothetical protein